MDEQLRNHTDSAPTSGPAVLRRPRVRLGAVVALALAAGFVAWVVTSNRNSGSSPRTTAAPVVNAIAPIALSASGLRTLAGAVKQPIYWSGPKQGYMYELTRTKEGRIFVRYLPAGVKAGAPGAKYLIVATYPFPKALSALQAVAKGNQIGLPGGGIAVVDKTYPKSVHLAYPGVAYQVEVFDPSPARARQVAVSGDVQPVH
jgi:hypothetical protein